MKFYWCIHAIYLFWVNGVIAHTDFTARQKTFHSMGKEVRAQMERYARVMGTKKWTYETAAKDLPCQIGSLTKLLMQLKNERYRHHQTDNQIKENVSDELADILSLIIFMADELDIDLAEAWQKMLESDQKKFQSRTIG